MHQQGGPILRDGSTPIRSTPEQRRAALVAAHAIVQLEGLGEPLPNLADIERAIVAGSMSFDDACRAILTRGGPILRAE